MQVFQKGVLVKLNWRSCQDAAFMTDTLNAISSDEVFLQLKASALPDLDLTDAPVLVMRKWHSGHQKGMEFRAYVWDGQMTGLQQKDETAHYEQAADEEFKGLVFGKVKQLVGKVGEALEFNSYILDVYIDIAPKHKAWVQDITPLTAEFFGDSSLFSIEEVTQPVEECEFRTLGEDSALRPQKAHDN